jgi:hypothetical protein
MLELYDWDKDVGVDLSFTLEMFSEGLSKLPVREEATRHVS